MSDTQHSADDCMKLLDRGWEILLFKNALGNYTAVPIRPGSVSRAKKTQQALARSEETDDFTPSQALYRLTEKVFGRIA